MTPPNHVGDLSIPWFSYYYPQKPKSPFSHLVRKPQLADLRHMGQLALSCLQYAAQFLSQHAGEPWGMWPGGFHKWGIPNSWMVYFMENPKITWMMQGGTPMTKENSKYVDIG
jgi:hypothetical protein